MNIPDDEISKTYDLRDTGEWKLTPRRHLLASDSLWEKHFTKCLYRPFDIRDYYDSEILVDRPRQDVMRHMEAGINFGLIFMRQVALQDDYSHFGLARYPVDNRAFYSNKGIMSLAPLYLYDVLENDSSSQSSLSGKVGKHMSSFGRNPNINHEFIADLESRLNLKFVSDGCGDLESTFGPEGVFNYIYAVFHSSIYRKRYAEFLKIDFPRVPLTSNIELFRKLCALGKELVGLHLLESSKLEDSKLTTHYHVRGDNFVEKGYPKYDDQLGFVKINKNQYLDGVSSDVWDFHVGGYQVCEKWLKDRRGRQLSYDDITHYRMIIAALKETIRLMEEIDKAIPGWPIE